MRSQLLVAVALAVACAPKAEQAAPAGPVALDSAAAVTAVNTALAQYREAVLANDAARIAATFTEDATATYFGSPTANGRAAIEALYAASIAAAKATDATMILISADGSIPGMITALGTDFGTVDSAGTAVTSYYRWAAVLRQGADAQWRWSFVMAFPDSVTRKK